MKRLPIIRHIRYVLTRRSLRKTYQQWQEKGLLPTNYNYDLMVLNMIWRGEA